MSEPIIVTGAAGFIGARIVERLNREGRPVISVDQLAHFNERGEHSGLDFGTRIDRDEFFGRMDALDPKSVLHMGACSSTEMTDVAYLKKVNVDYSKRLWEYCTREKIPFVYASSAATYGAGERGFEDDESRMSDLKPLNAYGRSKLEFDLWALDQEKQGHSPPSWAGLKFFNVYGFGEAHKGSQASVVYHAFRQIRDSGRVKLFRSHKDGIEDGHQARDFPFVEDVVDAVLFCAEKPVSRGIFNVGTGKARTFLDLARAVFKAMGVNEEIEWIDTPEKLREHYQYFTEAPMAKLKGEGFKGALTPLEEGVARTVRRLATADNPPPR